MHNSAIAPCGSPQKHSLTAKKLTFDPSSADKKHPLVAEEVTSSPPKRHATVSPSEACEWLPKLKELKQRILSWFTILQSDVNQRQQLITFFHSEKNKLSKKELPFFGYSILRLKNHTNDTVFRIVSHETLGIPGTFGRIKLVLPLSYCPESKIMEVNLNWPMALKIIRHGGICQQSYQNPALPMHAVLQKLEPETYGVMSRTTESETSRYAAYKDETLGGDRRYKAELMHNEMSSNLKHYVCMTLFPGSDLMSYFQEKAAEKQNLSDQEVVTILTGIINEIERLHRIGYAHRDIKPENILFNVATKTISLIDFDFTAKLNEYSRLSYTPGYWCEDKVKYSRERTDYLRGYEYVTFYRDHYALACIVNSLLALINPCSVLKSLLTNLVEQVFSGKKGINFDALKENVNARMQLKKSDQEIVKSKSEVAILTLKLLA
jgi:hypothetical protein